MFERVWDRPWTAPYTRFPISAWLPSGPSGPLQSGFILANHNYIFRNDKNEVEFSAIDFFGDAGFRCAQTVK